VSLLAEGEKLSDTYTVERFLGEGAFAEVYRVQHRFLGRQAMKVFKTKGMTLEEIKEMLDEAVLLSRIGHPNIIRVFEANILQIGRTTYGFFTMEYVPGGTLNRYWQSYESKLMPVEEAVAIMKQVCSGLSVAHGETPPVIHRDIKPQNLLIGYDSSGMRVKVSDFGLAKRVNPMTLLASAKGTLGFKPPESLENLDSCAADVWALGTTLYLLLTDKLPFPSLDERSISEASRFVQKLRPASLYNIQVDTILDSLVARCLARERNDRYANAQELLKDLNNWKPAGTSEQLRSKPLSGKSSKTVFAECSPLDKNTIEEKIQEAVELSKLPGKLPLAADILEEIISKDRSLRERYESRLKLWRKGMTM